MDHYDEFDFTHQGLRFTARLYHDTDRGAPWEEADGHGPVREAHTPHWRGGKRAGERPLNQPDRREAQFYYDWQEAMRIARRDGWGMSPEDREAFVLRHGRAPTKGEIAAHAVDRDFEYLEGWVNDRWHWCGVSVQPEGADDDDFFHALWGIESEAEDYLREVAEELADEIVRERRAAWRAALKEARERKAWACRDVVTV